MRKTILAVALVALSADVFAEASAQQTIAADGKCIVPMSDTDTMTPLFREGACETAIFNHDYSQGAATTAVCTCEPMRLPQRAADNLRVELGGEAGRIRVSKTLDFATEGNVCEVKAGPGGNDWRYSRDWTSTITINRNNILRVQLECYDAN